jgi:hypothetical protein
LPSDLPLFGLGRVVATPASLQALEGAGASPLTYLSRHQYGDYGDRSPADVGLNESAVVDGSRIFSVYRLTNGITIWIITEATDDNGYRLATTILLPAEY